MARHWILLRLFIVLIAFGVGLAASPIAIERINSQQMAYSWNAISNLLIMGVFLVAFAAIGWMIMMLVAWVATSRKRTWRWPNWTETPFSSPIQVPYMVGIASLANGVGSYLHVWVLSDKFAAAWFLAGISVSIGLGSILAAFLAATIFGSRIRKQ